MSILIFVVILILALACWLIQSAPVVDARFKWALQAIAVVLAIVVILERLT